MNYILAGLMLMGWLATMVIIVVLIVWITIKITDAAWYKKNGLIIENIGSLVGVILRLAVFLILVGMMYIGLLETLGR